MQYVGARGAKPSKRTEHTSHPGGRRAADPSTGPLGGPPVLRPSVTEPVVVIICIKTAARVTFLVFWHIHFLRHLPPPFRPTLGSLCSTGRVAFNGVKSWRAGPRKAP